MTFNCNGQRVTKYALMQMNQEKSVFQIVAEYNIVDKKLISYPEISWPNGKVPPDTPMCGYNLSKCPCK